MFWFLYNLLFATGYTLLMPKFLWRMRRRGGYRRGFGQRFGFYASSPPPRDADATGGRVWVHAVSVGEVHVALRFMGACRAVRPDLVFCLTTTTSTGHAIAESHLDPRDELLYFPLDFPGCVRRALDRIRPTAIALTECELWPNLLRLATARGIPVALINGRISDASFRGYRTVRPVCARVLPLAAGFFVQDEADAERLRALGATAGSVRVMGSVKYDLLDRRAGCAT